MTKAKKRSYSMNTEKLVRVLFGTGQVLIIAAHIIAKAIVRRLPPAN